MLTGVLIVVSIATYLLIGAITVGACLRTFPGRFEKVPPQDPVFPIPPWKLMVYAWPLVIVMFVVAVTMALVVACVCHMILAIEKIYKPIKSYVKVIRWVADMPEQHYDENLGFRH